MSIPFFWDMLQQWKRNACTEMHFTLNSTISSTCRGTDKWGALKFKLLQLPGKFTSFSGDRGANVWEVRVGRTGILANVSITVRQLGLEQVSTPFPVLFHYTGLCTEHSSANWNRNVGLGLGREMIILSPFIWRSCLLLKLFRRVRDPFIELTWDSSGWIGIVLEAWLHEINNNGNDFAVDGNSAILSNQSVS